MAKRNIFEEFGIDKSELEQQFAESLKDWSEEQLTQELSDSVRDYTVDTVLQGRVADITDDDVMIDVGYKSEGVVAKREWPDPSAINIGDAVEVLLEAVEDDSGLVQLSKYKADRIRAWERIVSRHDEGDIVTGRVSRKIKGGLLLDIGVPVFLPASQVDIRQPGEIADYIGRMLTCKILKIDEGRRNIVVSRRQLIESQRAVMKRRLLEKMEQGEIRAGKVKNIVDFGAFVDLGGIDGLLHITDMSWGRISHPSEMVAIDDEIEIKILNIDAEKEKVALGLKQKTASPWEDVEKKYPVDSTVRGEVVNLMNYGAFVKLEEGVEGLVHISEMSWTRRINHPSEVVAIGDAVDVVVLGIDKNKEEISLGMKQTEQNPWELVQQNYPAGTRVVGRVRNLTNYGAFIEIEEGIDGLLHVSDMSWTRKVNHPSEVVQKGQTIETEVLEVDPAKRRVALGLKQLQTDPWQEDIPSRYTAGSIARGVVSKLTSFGAFVELEDGLEGLLHISELSDKKISSPEEIVDVGDIIDLRVIRVDSEARKIGLSLRKDTPDEAADIDHPKIVIRSEELEEAENAQLLVKQAMQEAPQRQPQSGKKPAAPKAPTGGAGLEIPVEVVTGKGETAKEAEEPAPGAAAEPAQEAPAEEQPAELTEADAPPAQEDAPVTDEAQPVETEESAPEAPPAPAEEQPAGLMQAEADAPPAQEDAPVTDKAQPVETEESAPEAPPAPAEEQPAPAGESAPEETPVAEAESDEPPAPAGEEQTEGVAEGPVAPEDEEKTS